MNSKSNWLTTDGTKIVVDTSKATASTTMYGVETGYYLWCACSSSTYSRYDYEYAYLYFQIKTKPLTSVTTAQFASTYTFYVEYYGYIYYPSFTTVPSSTGDWYKKISLTVNGT